MCKLPRPSAVRPIRQPVKLPDTVVVCVEEAYRLLGKVIPRPPSSESSPLNGSLEEPEPPKLQPVPVPVPEPVPVLVPVPPKLQLIWPVPVIIPSNCCSQLAILPSWSLVPVLTVVPVDTVPSSPVSPSKNDLIVVRNEVAVA